MMLPLLRPHPRTAQFPPMGPLREAHENACCAAQAPVGPWTCAAIGNASTEQHSSFSRCFALKHARQRECGPNMYTLMRACTPGGGSAFMWVRGLRARQAGPRCTRPLPHAPHTTSDRTPWTAVLTVWCTPAIPRPPVREGSVVGGDKIREYASS